MADSDALLKITINGQEEELDPTEAAAFIETGRKTRELETKYNTSFDKVWPEYGKSREQLKAYEQELADAKAQLTEYTAKKESNAETPQDVKAAQESARKLGIVLQDDVEKAGYIKKDDLETWYASRKEQDQAINKVLADADKLEKDLNGSDGRPKFNKRAVMAYASAYGFSDLQAAYEEMHQEALAPWKAAQVAAQKKSSLKTLGANGEKSPTSPKVNRDNFRQILKESMYGSEE